ncbi:MAG: hypothetical protein ACE5F9_09130 [Phycisphaerae bacterium]
MRRPLESRAEPAIETASRAISLITALAAVSLVAALGAGRAPAQTITEIIDATGDGAGNGLGQPFGVAVDAAGNTYVTGASSHNAFKITLVPDCNTNGIPDECEDTGACCLPDGTCMETVQTCCEADGGAFNGVGTTCDEPPTVMCSARAASAAGGQFLRRTMNVWKDAKFLTGGGYNDSANGNLIIEFSAMGVCGPVPATAVIEITCSGSTQQIPVQSGQLIDLECEADEDECEVEEEHGILEIEAVNAILIVTAADAAGNTTTCTVDLCALTDDGSAPSGDFGR